MTPEERDERTAWLPRSRNVSFVSVVMWVYASDSALQWMWECISMKPGIKVPPELSITRASASSISVSSDCEQTLDIVSPSITTAAFGMTFEEEPSINRSAFRTSFMLGLHNGI